jgi:CRP/FNR family transcriptional regulator, cyclic AMP receptor protein
MAERKLEYLKRVPIFARCSKSELEALARNADEIELPAGRLLIEQGRPNHTFFIVMRGEVAVDVQGRPAGRLGPGDFFGEISMIDVGPATATITTATPLEALVMSHAQFHNAIKSNEMIALRVMAVMAERLRKSGLLEGAR